MNFGYILKNLRERNNQSQIDIAKILNISNSLYSRYEKEIELIPMKHLNTLCNYYKVSLDYSLGLSDKKNYSKYKESIDKSISKTRLKEIRKENKITQVKLASILNTTQSTIAGYENGTNIIATPFLYTICKKYNISADYLLGKTDEPKYLKK